MKRTTFTLLILILSTSCFADLKIGNWSLSGTKAKSTAKAQLAHCQSLEKQHEYKKAIAAHKQLLSRFENEREAEESYVRIGELHLLLGQRRKAEKYFSKLLKKQFVATAKIFGTLKKNKVRRKYWWKEEEYNEQARNLIFQILLKNLQDRRDKTSSPIVNVDFKRVLNNLLALGKAYQGIKSAKAPLVKKGKPSKRFKGIYHYILKRAPGFNGAAFMQNELAKEKLRKKKYLEAIVEFRKLTYDYSLSDEAQEASFHIGLCHLSLSRGPGYNEENLNNASINLKDHLRSYPGSKHQKIIKEKLIEIKNIKASTQLLRAKFYIRRKQWKAAGIYLDDLLRLYTKSDAAIKGKALIKKYKNIQMPVS